MNSRSVSVPRSSTDAPREDWLRAGVLAGFLGTFAMTIVLLAAYWLASTIGSADGGVIQRWCWALVNNPVAERTADGVVLAIGANLAMGLLLALVYARYAEPRLHGPELVAGYAVRACPLAVVACRLPAADGRRRARDGHRRRSPADHR